MLCTIPSTRVMSWKQWKREVKGTALWRIISFDCFCLELFEPFLKDIIVNLWIQMFINHQFHFNFLTASSKLGASNTVFYDVSLPFSVGPVNAWITSLSLKATLSLFLSSFTRLASTSVILMGVSFPKNWYLKTSLSYVPFVNRVSFRLGTLDFMKSSALVWISESFSISISSFMGISTDFMLKVEGLWIEE